MHDDSITITLPRSKIVEIFRRWNEEVDRGECGGDHDPTGKTEADHFIALATAL